MLTYILQCLLIFAGSPGPFDQPLSISPALEDYCPTTMSEVCVVSSCKWPCSACHPPLLNLSFYSPSLLCGCKWHGLFLHKDRIIFCCAMFLNLNFIYFTSWQQFALPFLSLVPPLHLPSLSFPSPIQFFSISLLKRACLNGYQPAITYQVAVRLGTTSSIKAQHISSAGGRSLKHRQQGRDSPCSHF